MRRLLLWSVAFFAWFLLSAVLTLTVLSTTAHATETPEPTPTPSAEPEPEPTPTEPVEVVIVEDESTPEPEPSKPAEVVIVEDETDQEPVPVEVEVVAPEAEPAADAPGVGTGVYVDPATGSVRVSEEVGVALGVAMWLAALALGLHTATAVLP